MRKGTKNEIKANANEDGGQEVDVEQLIFVCSVFSQQLFTGDKYCVEGEANGVCRMTSRPDYVHSCHTHTRKDTLQRSSFFF